MTRKEAAAILNTLNNIINEAGATDAIITIRAKSGYTITAEPHNITIDELYIIAVTTYSATYCIPYNNIECMSN